MTTSGTENGRFRFPPIHPEGIQFVVISAIIVGLLHLILGRMSPWIGLTLWFIPVAVYLFFRDPERVPPQDEAAIVSPADGTVCMIAEVPMPTELKSSVTEPVWRVSIFMSVFNVHVNRAPAAGKITATHYVQGLFINASLDKASEQNERKMYLMETSHGKTLAFVQIAGLVARRIVSFVEEGAAVGRAQRFGLIRFGSRVDVYLPLGVRPNVLVGQTMIAGETVLARNEN